MFCENYKQTLLSAAAGQRLPAEAQQHLFACESCQSAFTEEQALIAAMDSGLRNLMSKEPSGSLAKRVRAEIARELAQPRRFRLVWVGVPAAAIAALLLAVFSPRAFEDLHRGGAPVVVVAPGPAAPSAGEKTPSPQPDRSLFVARLHRVHLGRRTLLAAAREPEVLIAPGQEAALMQYVALLQKKPRLARIQGADSTKEPLAIEPLEIAELPAQPLAIEPLGSESADSSR